MFTVELELTRACNLDCRYCFEKKDSLYTIVFEEAIERIEFAFQRAAVIGIKEVYIDFTGGEPLLAFDLIKKILLYLKDDKFKQFQISYGMVTNGTLLDKNLIKFLADHQFDLTLSLDGDSVSHDMNRVLKDGTGSYNTIIKNRIYFLKYCKEIMINMVITLNNYKRFYDNFMHINQLGFKIIRTKLDINSVWQEDDFKALKKELDHCVDTYFEINKKGQNIYWDYIEEGVKSISDQRRHYFCGAGIISILIAIDGSIRCCGICEDNGVIGDIWNGINEEKVNKLCEYHRNLEGKCIDCNISEYCPQCDCIFLNEALKHDNAKLDKFCIWYQFRHEMSKDIIQKVKKYRMESI